MCSNAQGHYRSSSTEGLSSAESASCNALLHEATNYKVITKLIIGVAIKQGDLMVCLPKPNRHHHCIRYAVQTLGLTARPIAAGHGLQGFYTDDGKYLNRQDAMIYAKASGQLINPNPTKDLFSEDLW